MLAIFVPNCTTINHYYNQSSRCLDLHLLTFAHESLVVIHTSFHLQFLALDLLTQCGRFMGIASQRCHARVFLAVMRSKWANSRSKTGSLCASGAICGFADSSVVSTRIEEARGGRRVGLCGCTI